MSVIKAKLPGNPIPKVDKRSNENILYTVDLTELLTGTNELTNEIQSVQCALPIESSKTRQGKFIEIRIPPSEVRTAAYQDYNVSILFKTTLENIRSAVFTVRVYK